MGITCSLCDEVKCEKCGVPRSYYRNSTHAARKSCRGNKHSEIDINMQYHKWS